MTIEKILEIMYNNMMNRVNVAITFGSYVGKQYVALSGSVNTVAEKLRHYPELSEESLDPNGAYVYNDTVELFATLYKGEHGYTYEFTYVVDKNATLKIQARGLTVDDCLKYIKEVGFTRTPDSIAIIEKGTFIPAKVLFNGNPIISVEYK